MLAACDLNVPAERVHSNPGSNWVRIDATVACQVIRKEDSMTDAEMIEHLWTHRTQDHPVYSDEELMIERGEGIHIWTRRGKKLIDGFSGLMVVQVGHGRHEIADAIRTQAAK